MRLLSGRYFQKNGNRSIQCLWRKALPDFHFILFCVYQPLQTDLEMVTEDLAQKVNRPYLRTPRHKIIRAACLVQQKRQEFLASVARGVAPADSPEAPRRR